MTSIRATFRRLKSFVIEMTYATQLQYTDALVRRAIAAYWRRTVGGLIYVLPVCVAVLVGCWYRGFTPWWVFAFGVIVLAVSGLAVALFAVHYRSSMLRFRALGDQAVAFRVDDHSFTLEAPMGTTTFQWPVVKELWKFNDVWLLLYSKAQFNTLPLADISEDMRSFVESKIRAAGGKIVG
jgi:hypothetical protein